VGRVSYPWGVSESDMIRTAITWQNERWVTPEEGADMPDMADRRLRIAAARADFLSSGERVAEPVSDVVAASWLRSRSAGVDAGTSEANYHRDVDMSSRLVRCAQPIITRLREETADLPLSVALTDNKARVLSRSDNASTIGMLLENVAFSPGFGYAEGGVGTNGVGTVFESGQPVHIIGPEHFSERLQPFACAGAPIKDPLSGRIEGVLDISCLTEHSSPLMHSLVRSAAHDIERNLLVDRSQSQQALFETYVRFDARTHGAVLAVGGSVVMANAMMQSLFRPDEQLTITEHARYLMARRQSPVDEIELSTGKVVRLRGKRIVVGEDVAGLVLDVLLVAEGSSEATLGAYEDFAVPRVIGAEGIESELSAIRHTTPSGGDGASPLWRRAYDDITAALTYHDPLLVLGETGAGKFTLVADIYHQVTTGGRSVAIDAAEIGPTTHTNAEETLEAFAVPTLFIFRNIDTLSTDGVDRLNDFLLALADSEREAYVAATLSDANLDSDLPFQELLVHFQRAVTVPPLRHRTEDLPMLASRVLDDVAPRRAVKISAAAMRIITRYTWPRNLSQLDEALRAALLRRPVGEIQPEDLPGYCHQASRRELSPLESGERDAIIKALLDADGNRVQAATALGIARSSLYRKLKTYGITTI
jgi:transcriptional regulator of acetoin/glycerol metabolism